LVALLRVEPTTSRSQHNPSKNSENFRGVEPRWIAPPAVRTAKNFRKFFEIAKSPKTTRSTAFFESALKRQYLPIGASDPRGTSTSVFDCARPFGRYAFRGSRAQFDFAAGVVV